MLHSGLEMLMMIRTKCLSYIYDYLWYFQLKKKTEKDIVEKMCILVAVWSAFNDDGTKKQYCCWIINKKHSNCNDRNIWWDFCLHQPKWIMWCVWQSKNHQYMMNWQSFCSKGSLPGIRKRVYLSDIPAKKYDLERKCINNNEIKNQSRSSHLLVISR